MHEYLHTYCENIFKTIYVRPPSGSMGVLPPPLVG